MKKTPAIQAYPQHAEKAPQKTLEDVQNVSGKLIIFRKSRQNVAYILDSLRNLALSFTNKLA